MVGRAGSSEKRALLPHGTHPSARGQGEHLSHLSPSVPATHGHSLQLVMPPALGAQHMEMGRGFPCTPLVTEHPSPGMAQLPMAP